MHSVPGLTTYYIWLIGGWPHHMWDPLVAAVCTIFSASQVHQPSAFGKRSKIGVIRDIARQVNLLVSTLVTHAHPPPLVALLHP